MKKIRYFTKCTWPIFIYQEKIYDLSHLDEWHFDILDFSGEKRRLAVTYSDHCFTRKHEQNDHNDLFYPGGSRNPSIFSFERYHHSLQIAEHILRAANGKVWNASAYHGYQENFAAIPTINQEGIPIFYAIIFSLERVGKDLPIDLHMRVRSAYPCKNQAIPTFGEIRFNKLIALCMLGKSPTRITDPHRKKPRLQLEK